MFKKNLQSLRAEFQVVREIDGGFFLTLATDHPRLFKRKHDGIVFVCSNYPDNAPGLLESQGFVARQPIYTNETTTYCKAFNNRGELNKLLVKIDELRNKRNAFASSCNLSKGDGKRNTKDYTAIKRNVKFSGRRSYSGKERRI